MKWMIPKPEKGFSLVELMVALVIGLLVMFGAVQVFVSSKQSFNRMERLAERQESLRFIVDVMSLDIRSSDADSVEVAGGRLKLEYTGENNRKSDPYCSGGGDLASVEYYEDRGELKVDYDCSGGGAGSAQPIVGSLGGVAFDYYPAENYVEVTVVFSPAMPSESVDDRTFIFRVANREGVTR